MLTGHFRITDNTAPNAAFTELQNSEAAKELKLSRLAYQFIDPLELFNQPVENSDVYRTANLPAHIHALQELEERFPYVGDFQRQELAGIIANIAGLRAWLNVHGIKKG